MITVGHTVFLISDYSLASGNKIIGSGNGVLFSFSAHNNTVSNNEFQNNFYGILIGGDDNDIFNNTILSGTWGVLANVNSERNRIFYNDIVDQAVPGEDHGNGNQWSDKVGSTYFGNYWGAAYNGSDLVAPFGIGDTPFNISGLADSADLYPLVRPGTIPAPLISNPGDLFVMENTTGNSVAWQATTVIPSMYQIDFNGSVTTSLMWNGSLIFYSVDGLTPGEYNVTCTVYDIAGRSVSDTVVVTILSEIPSTQPPSDGPPLPEDLQTMLIGALLGIGLIGVLFLLLKLIRR